MQLKLTVNDDDELRTFAKNVILGQVRAITREEVVGEIVNAATRAALTRTALIERIIREETRKVVEGIVKQQLHSPSFTSRNLVREVVAEEVLKILKDIQKS